MVWLNISDDNEQIKRIVESNLYNAYPVADHTLDNIVGVVYLKDPVRQAGHAGLHPAAGIAPGQVHPGKTERL